jgi:hypothetical protein
MRCFVVFLIFSVNLSAQTNRFQVTNGAGQNISRSFHSEQIRSECVNGRRIICGKILKILPEGMVVDSGYTDLMRPPLNKSWLVPGSATSIRADNLLEKKEPECACIGTVFLSDIPKTRLGTAKPKQYDYVVLLGYPAGNYTYETVGTVRKTVRRFTTNIDKAVVIISAGREKANNSQSTK